MTIYRKHSGMLKTVSQVYRAEGGELKAAREIYRKYNGALELVFRSEAVITLSNSEDVVIADVLAAHSVPDTQQARIIVPNGVIIGATTTAQGALHSGDLSARIAAGTKTYFINSGDIQAAGGLAGEDGGPGITASHTFSFHNTSTGKVRGGGGGGGDGGRGGHGNDVGNWSGWEFVDPGTLFVKSSNFEPNGAVYWYSSRMGDTYGGNYAHISGYVYQAGAYRYNYFYEIRRATGPHEGTRGSAGVGGVGQGYNQSPSAGGNGGAGTLRAGDGGQGGSGGGWGQAGLSGKKGETGYKYSIWISNHPFDGDDGEVGGNAGLAIYAPGVTINYLNEGAIQGDTDFTAGAFQ